MKAKNESRGTPMTDTAQTAAITWYDVAGYASTASHKGWKLQVQFTGSHTSTPFRWTVLPESLIAWATRPEIMSEETRAGTAKTLPLAKADAEAYLRAALSGTPPKIRMALERIAAALAEYGAELRAEDGDCRVSVPTGFRWALEVEVPPVAEGGEDALNNPDGLYAVLRRTWDETGGMADEDLLAIVPEGRVADVVAALAEKVSSDEARVDHHTLQCTPESCRWCQIEAHTTVLEGKEVAWLKGLVALGDAAMTGDDVERVRAKLELLDALTNPGPVKVLRISAFTEPRNAPTVQRTRLQELFAGLVNASSNHRPDAEGQARQKALHQAYCIMTGLGEEEVQERVQDAVQARHDEMVATTELGEV